MSTAVWPLREAIDTTLLGDATYNTLIGGRAFDDGDKPESAALPFHTYGNPTEGGFETFSTDGNDGTSLLHCYGRDSKEVATMYGHINRLLNNQTITVTGHVVLRMSTSLLSISQDPSGASHGVVRVAALTQAAA